MAEKPLGSKKIRGIAGLLVTGFLLITLTGFGFQSGSGTLKQAGRVPGNCKYTLLQGTYAYTIDGAGFSIIDVSDPEKPVKKSSIEFTESPVSLELNGNYAYIADGNSGMKVIDISNPAAPVEKATLDTPGYLNQVKIKGNYAYLADDTKGLGIADVSNPLSPSIVTTYITNGQARRITFKDNYLLLSNYRGGLKVYDISSAVSPVLVTSIQTTMGLLNTAVSGNYLYLNWENAPIWVVQFANPSTLLTVSSTISPYLVDDLQVVGNKLYTVGGEGEFRQYDITTADSPVELTCTELGGRMASVSVNGTLAAIANSEKGLQLVSLADASQPVLKGIYSTVKYIWDVKADENYAYVSDLYHNLRIFDIRNPQKPTQVSSLEFDNELFKSAMCGQYLYLCNNAGGLKIVDISRPENPWVTGTYCPSLDTGKVPQFYDVALYGNNALVTDMYYGLRVIDVSNPAQPREIGTLANASTKGFRSIAIKDHYAFVADMQYGMKVYDLATVSQPALVGQWSNQTAYYYYQPYNYAMDIAIKGNYAYLACMGKGLYVVNISDPTNPQTTSVYTTVSRATAMSVEVDGNYAYIGTGYKGVKILDISDLTDIKEVASSTSAGYARNGFVNLYKYFFSAEGLSGMNIMQYQPEGYVAAPTNLTCVSPSTSENQLYWKDNSDNEDYFVLECHNGDGNFIGIAQIPANSTSLRISNLSASTPYYYRLYARTSSYISGYSNTACSVPGAPKSPSDLYAVSLDSGSYHLYWTDNSSNESGFALEVQLDNGSWQTLSVLAANKTDYTVQGLEIGHTYAFRVRARNAVASSEPTNEVRLYVAEGITGIPEAHWKYISELD
jgi:hypothetical protein